MPTAEPRVPTTMWAVVRSSYGLPSTLAVSRVDVPQPGPGDVLVRVRAAALNPADVFSVTGRPLAGRLATGLARPRRAVPGRAFSGVVAIVGQDVTRFQPGDEVCAEVAGGAFAEYVVAPADALARRSRALSSEEAAAVPLAGVTALQGLRDKGRLAAGRRVLVNGASGGVGVLAVQIAKAAGAEATGVARGAKVAAVEGIGADHVIDADRSDFTDHTGRYDLILDLVGNHPLSRLRASLTAQGTLVLSSGPPSPTVRRILRAVVTSPFVGQRLVPLLQVASAPDLEHLADLADDGGLRPLIDRTYPFSQAAEALERHRSGRDAGRIVLVPDGS